MNNEPHLAPVKIKGKFSGDYKCSLCDTEFRPHPTDPGVMHQEFAAHKGQAHPRPKKPREDVNQAAARVVREATDKV